MDLSKNNATASGQLRVTEHIVTPVPGLRHRTSGGPGVTGIVIRSNSSSLD